ncbi:alpha/beta hydrolase [Secundilactobacillus malefermentans]|uniref:BD-FAE-like domain-containing protein n=1 Tax=Secundilactobacillus malefermentans TaxID=176292 RepID=A0A4R5NEG9_9LACO|nr:alpha/beta hydrolase [Secundilactobacillus malefermentans]KRM58654.1 esterase lipase [Secundilactobacillus malefermentans DSM 5705 = KCTC 3548]QEA31021.1 alpha/beta hydrolase [Secundilactobacillus malefermentans]TDG71352.1 hypothetical protein C5L31_001976 [Secundilactobacillus malefermentans]
MQIIQEKLSNQSAAYIKGYIRDSDVESNHFKYPAMVIIPGGSYTHIPEAQSETLSQAFLAKGYQSFYLRYSFVNEVHPLFPSPLVELAQSIALIRENAVKWHIDPNRIVIAGFSVGGHLAALYNDYWSTTWLQKLTKLTEAQLQINAAIISYPVIDPKLGFPTDEETIREWTDTPETYAAQNFVNSHNAPSFVWATVNDPVVPVKNSLAYVNALVQHGIDCELHLFHDGPHGLALANQQTSWKQSADNPHVAHWLTLATEWLADILSK